VLPFFSVNRKLNFAIPGLCSASQSLCWQAALQRASAKALKKAFKKVPFFLECVRVRRTLSHPAGDRAVLRLAFAWQAKAATTLPHSKERFLNTH
jgi:hypothetical protein